jgi:hypothetical protein
MKLTHASILTIGYLLVGYQLIKYTRITIKYFYLLESVKILLNYVQQFTSYKYVTTIHIKDIS